MTLGALVRSRLAAALLIILAAAIVVFTNPVPSAASSLATRPSVSYLADQSRFLLDASALALDGGPATYQWAVTGRPTGSSASLSGATTPLAALNVDMPGSYTVELIVTIGGVAGSPMIVTMSTGNVEPVAQIGTLGGVSPVAVNAAVLLTAADSHDADGDRLSYHWSLTHRPIGSVASIGAFGAARASFVPDVAGDYEVKLAVTDEAGIEAVDTIRLATGRGLTLADAGPDVKGVAGSVVFVDAFGSIDTAGQPLSAIWQIVSAPTGSAASLTDGVTLDQRETGRQRLVPDLDGLYVLTARVNNAASGSSDTDTMLMPVGVGANTPPVADAGTDRVVATATRVLLDGTRSTDADGNRLTYRWALLAAPAGSAATVSDAASPLAAIQPDTAGDYVLQLTVSDGQSVAHDTLMLSTGDVAPQASAGLDSTLSPLFAAQVDASASISSGGDSLAHAWNVIELGNRGAAGVATLSAPRTALTQISFGKIRRGQNLAAGLGTYDLIVFENANIRSQVLGRTFVGGNLQGLTSDYAGGVTPAGTAQDAMLTVAGAINGQRLTINNGGDVRAGGQINAGIVFSNGGRVISDPTVSGAALRIDMEAFSAGLATRDATASVTLPAGGAAPVVLNAIANASGVAVFNVDAKGLFENPKVPSVDLRSNGAEAIVINVTGNNVKHRNTLFTGGFTDPAVRSRVIWNFADAVNIHIDRSFAGTILAPRAQLLVNAELSGAAVVRSINQEAAISTPGFTGAAAFAAEIVNVDAAVLQAKVSEGTYDAFDTALVTRGNIAPIGRVTASAASVDPATLVTFSGVASGDANGEALTYAWSLLSRPAASQAAIAADGAAARLTPDVRGIYVAQLMVSDGVLQGAPVTAFVLANNRAPAITSTAPADAAVGDPFTYQAAAEDADGDALTWSLASGPAGMTIEAATGAVSWTPDTDGIFDAEIAVADGFGGTASQAFQLTAVISGNRYPPVIQPVADMTLRPGESVSFRLSASDPEGDAVTFWSPALPAGATLDTASGAFTFTANDELGVRTMQLTATDGLLSASVTARITVVPWPDTDPTRLSGVVLDAQDYANGVTTPVAGATVRIGTQNTLTGTDGRFSFNSLTGSGSVGITVTGATAAPAPTGVHYGVTSLSATAYANGDNRLGEPILLSRLNGEPFQLTEATDSLPPSLRSCRIQRADNVWGDSIALSALPLKAAEPLPAGTRISIWASSLGANAAERYAIVGSATVGADGTSLLNITGEVPSGTNLVVAPLSLTGKESSLQPKDSYVPSLLGEGNLQTGFSLPSYVSIGQNRAASFLYNSVTASPRPIITADVTIPADAALTATLEAELYVNGQKAPGVTVTRIDAAERPGTALPLETATSVVSVSVSFDASALPTGAYPYELYVFAGHTCAAGAAKIEGQVFVNNRASAPYGSGWKPTELQQLHVQPDGSVVVEEPSSGLGYFESEKTAALSPLPGLYDVFDPERADTGDIDGDGDIDLAVVEGKTGDVLIFKNSGPGTRQFTGPVRVDAGIDGNGGATTINFEPDTNDVAIGDLNGDGIADLATSHQFFGGGRVHLGNPDGSFSRIDFALRGDTSAVDLGDFDGDGNLDAAYSSFFYIHVVFGPISTSSVKKTWDMQYATAGDDIAVYDFDGDGRDEIVADGALGTRPEIISVARDRNSLSETAINVSRNPFNALQQFVSIGDINADGLAEIAFSGESEFIVVSETERGSGQYNVVKRIAPATSGKTESVAISDYTRNGKLRLFGVNKTNKLFIYDEGYIHKTGRPQSLDIAGSGDDAIVTADFDGDGVEDIVTFLETPAAGTPDDMAVYYGSAFDAGTFISPAGDYSTLVRNPDGTSTRRYKDGTNVTFNSLGQQESIKDSNGNTTSYTYDADGRLATVTDPAGLVTAYTYRADGQLEFVTDPDGRVTLFNYDAQGRLTSVTYPDGTSIEYDVNTGGQIIAETDQRGQTSTYNYGAAGRLTSVTTPDGGSVRVAIGKSLGLASFGVDLGAPAQANHVAPEDRVTALRDALGNAAEQEVNEWGAVVRTKDPIGRETFYERNGNNLVTRITAPSSVTASGTLVTELSYDERGNVTEKNEAVGTPLERSTSYTYEPTFNKVTSERDAAGFSITYAYDARGNLLTERNYALQAETYTYNAQGLMLTANDRRGDMTRYAYDARGQLETVTDPDGFVTRTVRDGRGNPLSTIEAAGTTLARRTDQTFDVMNRLLTSKNAEGEISAYAYDGEGNLLTATDPTGIASARTYDEKGRIASMIDPSSGATLAEYDLNDNITKVTAADGTSTAMSYDAVNRVTETVDALGIVRRVAYDSRDNVIAITDGRGNTTTFEYDALDRVIARTNPNGNTWRFEYDARDLRTATVKPDGTRVTFTYDHRRLLSASAVAGNAAARRDYGYFRDHLLSSATAADTTADKIVNEFGYNGRDLPTAVAMNADTFRSRGPMLFYSYDALGRRTLMRDTYGARSSYAYDKADRLTAIVLPSGKTTALGYDDAGRRISVRYPNGLTTNSAFETPLAASGATGRLASIAHGLDASGQGGSALNGRLGTFAYSYDTKGNVTGIAESGTPARTRAYGLDAIERLTAVTDGSLSAPPLSSSPCSSLAGTPGVTECYTLDEEGNRVASHRAAWHVTDPANRVQEDEVHQFEYDVNGNMVRKTVKTTGQTWRYAYTVYDELALATRHASAASGAPAELSRAYLYDALGRRVRETATDASGALTGATAWVYDGEHIAYEQNLRLDGTGSEVASYVSILCALPQAPVPCRIATRWYTHSDATDDVLAATPDMASAAPGTPRSPTVDAGAVSAGLPSPSASSFSYHSDHQGSVRAITGDTGQIVNAYSYDSYGNAEEAVEALAQPFRFTGREYDPVTGLYHYRARTYDASTGRFLQEDPIWFEAGDLNVYRYTWNNPTNWTDPSGMAAASERLALYAIAGNTATALTLNGTRAIIVRLFVQQGTRYVLQEVVKSVTFENKGLGCLIGLKLASIGATIAEASSADVTADGCSIAWNLPPEARPSPPLMSTPSDGEHTKNKRPSTKAKHEKGQARKAQDRGGESGDVSRRPPRKRPPDWRGPWPPKK